MGRLVLIATVFLVAVAVILILLLGAFPPRAHRAPVEHVIPNTQFKSP
jgi:hypothetical protein